MKTLAKGRLCIKRGRKHSIYKSSIHKLVPFLDLVRKSNLFLSPAKSA